MKEETEKRIAEQLFEFYTSKTIQPSEYAKRVNEILGGYVLLDSAIDRLSEVFARESFVDNEEVINEIYIILRANSMAAMLNAHPLCNKLTHRELERVIIAQMKVLQGN